MPNTVDVVQAFQVIIGSGLVVSGNSYITVARQLTSGDAMNSFPVSGKTDLITLQKARDVTVPLLGGVYTEIADFITAEIFVHYQYQGNTNLPASGASARIEQMVEDFKVTVASGAWNSGYNLSRPTLFSEGAPVMHEKFGKSRLIYRTRYLL